MDETLKQSILANTAFYLKIEPGVTGETQVSDVSGYMKILEFKWATNHAGSFHRDQGGSTGHASGTDFFFVMKTCSSSPELMQGCANGTHYDKATLVCQKKANNKTINALKVTLTKVLISSFETGFELDNAFGDAVPVDKVRLNFGDIKVEYTPNSDKGVAGSAKVASWSYQKDAK